MNNESKKSQIVFTILVSVILAAAIWWVLGGFVMPIALCGVDNDKQCNPNFVNALSVVVSALIAGILMSIRINKILKK